MTNRHNNMVSRETESNRKNSFALTNDDVMTALETSSSSMAAANNTFEETVALITAANEIIQNPAKVGKHIAQTYSNVWCGLIA